MIKSEEIIKRAVISGCKRYRYYLSRDWSTDRFTKKLVFIMLNPSTADDKQDDPTIRRCMGFAKQWGYGGVIVVNLFAYRATNPKELDEVSDPVGSLNDNQLKLLSLHLSSLDVVYAWGNYPKYKKRAKQVQKILPHGKPLAICANGCPRHPLFLPYSIPNPFIND